MENKDEDDDDEVTSERELCTKHGQNLNTRGKETMANKIELSIENVLKRKVDPINMKWQEDDGVDSQKQIQGGAKRTHVFKIIVTLFIFNIKNYVNTKTTCNKCSFDYLH